MIVIKGTQVGFLKLQNVVFLCSWRVQVEQCTVHHRRRTQSFHGIVATLSHRMCTSSLSLESNIITAGSVTYDHLDWSNILTQGAAIMNW